jgi:hypothetical protein
MKIVDTLTIHNRLPSVQDLKAERDGPSAPVVTKPSDDRLKPKGGICKLKKKTADASEFKKLARKYG